jgi:hypothetical protein
VAVPARCLVSRCLAARYLAPGHVRHVGAPAGHSEFGCFAGRHLVRGNVYDAGTVGAAAGRYERDDDSSRGDDDGADEAGMCDGVGEGGSVAAMSA